MNMKKYIFPVLALAALSLASCENAEKEFPDFEGGVSVFFPYQTPIRTIMLGSPVEASLNNDLDNAHKFVIYAAQGGAYKTKDINVSIAVDNSLCNNLTFDGGAAVTPMPESYYSLSSTNITNFSNYMGGVEVSLTDAFFADPKSIGTTYVIPIVMKSQTGADRILEGEWEGMNDSIATPKPTVRTDASLWKVAPMDYTLYCVRYVNPWEAYYLVKGSNADILKCDIVQVTTASLSSCNYTILIDGGKKVNVKTDTSVAVDLTLNFSGDNCTVMQGGNNIGSGSYAKAVEDVAPNLAKRDVLKLSYTVNGVKVDEELVMQRRGDFAGTVKEFTAVYNN